MDFEILINRDHLLNKNFVPNDLIITDENENNFHNYIDANLKPMISNSIYPYFLQMKNDMAKLEMNIIIGSGYRSYAYQQTLLEKNIEKLGKEQAEKQVAFPGSSEHQSGIAFDVDIIRNGKIINDESIDNLEIKWLIDNSYKYGFILRYPLGKENITGYNFEPWHYRYVGLRLSHLLKYFDITLEEYYDKKIEYDTSYRNINEDEVKHK